MTLNKGLTLSALCIALAACGGGGGSSSGSSSNSNGNSGGNGGGNTGPGGNGTMSPSVTMSNQNNSPNFYGTLGGAAVKNAELLHSIMLSILHPDFVYQISSASCNTGSASSTWADSNSDSYYTGEAFNATLTNCTVGGFSINGTYTADTTAPGATPTDHVSMITFNGNILGATVAGTFTMQVSDSTVPPFISHVGSATVPDTSGSPVFHNNFDMRVTTTGNQDALTWLPYIQDMNGKALQLETTNDVTLDYSAGHSDYPISGELQLTDDVGATLTLTEMNPDNNDLRVSQAYQHNGTFLGSSAQWSDYWINNIPVFCADEPADSTDDDCFN